MNITLAYHAIVAISRRELLKFWHQKGRLLSALVRPMLWLIVFAAGFQNIFGVSIIPPYDSYIEYQEYVVPGLLGMVVLFNGMQSSLAMVYDREVGLMKLLLTAPLPRWFLLLAKLLAGTLLSLIQAYAFLALCWAFQVNIPLSGWVTALPALFLSGLMLGALGLLLSVYVKQLENFAGTMNFVIFPMFFMSTALYPLWKLQESGAEVVHQLATFNPFTHAVELIRFSLYGQFNGVAALTVLGTFCLFFLLAVYGYKPQRGLLKKTKR